MMVRNFTPLAGAVLFFVISAVVYAVTPLQPIGLPEPVMMTTQAGLLPMITLSPPLPALGAVDAFLRPHGLPLTLMLITVLLMMLAYLWRCWRQARQEVAPNINHVPLALALGLAAAWPWVALNWPLSGRLLCGAMLALALLALFVQRRRSSDRIQIAAVAIFAGWATALCFWGLGNFVATIPGLNSSEGAMIGILAIAALTTAVQMRMGRRSAYAVAVIWGLAGIAVLELDSDLKVAMAAILGIAAISTAVVRTTS